MTVVTIVVPVGTTYANSNGSIDVSIQNNTGTSCMIGEKVEDSGYNHQHTYKEGSDYENGESSTLYKLMFLGALIAQLVMMVTLTTLVVIEFHPIHIED